MDEGWPQIKEIVGSALELGPEQRMDFVRKACGDNEALRREVESLLACDQEADRILEHSPSDDIFSVVEPSMIGRRVGTYRIIRETGQGGMAVVYLAERDDLEFQRRVAIKMVKPGANSEEIVRRFRNERQMLAALDHPNIVKLLDGGTTGEGRPYLVMEFVEGSPIDKYCDSRRLTVTERLGLFRIVCAAVQYAHTHQVIHRDLKPSNVIITEDGVPRLLDFGIAKVLAPETLPAQATTTGQWRPMTPDYASPEQVRGKGVTYATDIYSLGVLLYELLTGHRPYQTTSESWAEIERVVREEVPGKPSVVIKKPQGCICPKELLETAPQHIADVRRVTVEQLARSLKGDLDTIVLMALRKEPERRYASVADLCADIDRYLAGLPVRARKPTVGYRSGKFLRRHQETVTAVAVIILLLGVVLGWQGPKIWKNRTAGASPAGQPTGGQESYALTSDLDWGIELRAEALVAEKKVAEKDWKLLQRHLYFRDLANSTALIPVLSGAAQPSLGQPAVYTVKMPACYPYSDPVEYGISWTGGAVGAGATVADSSSTVGRLPDVPDRKLAGNAASQTTGSTSSSCTLQPALGQCWSDPAKNASVGLVWPSVGSFVVSATPLGDQHGRKFDPARTAQVSVNVQQGGVNSPASASATPQSQQTSQQPSPSSTSNKNKPGANKRTDAGKDTISTEGTVIAPGAEPTTEQATRAATAANPPAQTKGAVVARYNPQVAFPVQNLTLNAPDPNPNHLPNWAAGSSGGLAQCSYYPPQTCQSACGSIITTKYIGVKNTTAYPVNGTIEVLLQDTAGNTVRRWTVGGLAGNGEAYPGKIRIPFKCVTPGTETLNADTPNYVLLVNAPFGVTELDLNDNRMELYIDPTCTIAP